MIKFRETISKFFFLVLTLGTSLFLFHPYCFVCVGGNLLKQLPTEINKSRSRNGSILFSTKDSPRISSSSSGSGSGSSSLLPRPPSKVPSSMSGMRDEDFLGFGESVGGISDFKLYCEFIGEFSEFMAWSSFSRATLVFPTLIIHPRICAYFRTTLLQFYGLQTVCMSSSLETTANTNNASRSSRKPSNDSPMISLHFLLTPSRADGGNSNNNIHPKFLIHYRASRQILVLTGNSSNKEMLIQQLQPEVNSNYKWILASKAYSTNPDNESCITIEEVYGFATSSEPVSQSIGSWSFSQGIQIDADSRHGLNNFMGRLIRITTVEVRRKKIYKYKLFSRSGNASCNYFKF